MDFLKRNIGTKTFWAGIASIASGIGLALNGELKEGLSLILLGITAICGRDAVGKIGAE